MTLSNLELCVCSCWIANTQQKTVLLGVYFFIFQNPCDEATCAEHEICLARRRGPCLAGTTTDGDVVQCQQYQCGKTPEGVGGDVPPEVRQTALGTRAEY